MCIGTPVQVMHVEACHAVCRDRAGATCRIDLLLVGDQLPGTWLMSFMGTARKVMSAAEAARVGAALDAVQSLLDGGTPDLDVAFSDLIEREPQLPDFLRAQAAASPAGPDMAIRAAKRSEQHWRQDMNDSFAVDGARSAEEAFEQLLQRLVRVNGLARLSDEGEGGVDRFAAGTGDSVALLTDTPKRCPEAWDLAVVLPEVLKLFESRLRAGVANPAESANIAARFGVTRFPALLFQRGGDYIGVLEGMRDWNAFPPAFERMLGSAPARAPGIGIAVRAESGAACR